jgi:hypothetical protein
VIPAKDEPEIPALSVAPDILPIVVVNDQAELPIIAGAFVVDARRQRGVGLARKIGCDLALSLWTRGQLREPWIHTTDADAVPPVEAFDLDPPDAVALSLPLWHEPSGDPRIDEATALYELWLRYYVAGLRWAGSPWAFLTVGSAMAVRTDAYAAARGVPRRDAGEDFYLLTKLAKLGRVVTPDIPPVRIRSRLSTRVPFGTGPGVAKILATEPRFYDPRVFAALRAILGALEDGRDPEHDAWRQLGGPEGVLSATTSARTEDQRRRRIREWLDGFRTLKLVHLLQRNHPPRPWRQAVAEAPFCPAAIDDVDALRRALW